MSETPEAKSVPRTSGAKVSTLTKFLAEAGIVGPIIFTIVIVATGYLRPGYSQGGGAGISELGVGPNAILWNAGAILFGLLITAYAFGLHRGINEVRGSRIGPTLVAISGISFVGAGLFPAAPPTLPFHQSFALLILVASIAAPLFIAKRIGRGDEKWRHYRSYSALSGIAILVIFLAFGAGVNLQISQADFDAASKGIQVSPQGALGPWAGAIQRLFFAVSWLWMEVLAFHILALQRSRLR
jgi:hypothetical membrane protein